MASRDLETFKSAFDSSRYTSELESAKTTIKSAGETVISSSVDALSAIGMDLTTGWESWGDLASATGDATLDFINKQLDNLKKSITQTQKISIKSLIGVVSPYVLNLEDAIDILGEKIDDFEANLKDNLNQWFTDTLSDYGDYLMNDSGVQSAMSGLNIVKAYGTVMNTYNTISSSVSKVLETVEPFIPTVEILVALAQCWINPTAVGEATTKTSEEVQKQIQKLISVGLQPIRKYLYNIEIDIPTILLGALNNKSVRDALVANTGDDWLKSIFDEDFYNDTMYSLTWENTIKSAKNDVDTMVNNWGNFNFTDINGNSITRGEFMKSKFMTKFTKTFMKNAVSEARKVAYIRDIVDSDYLTARKTNQLIENKNFNNFDDFLGDTSGYAMIKSIDSIRVISRQLI